MNFTASRLSDGNKMFPDEINIDDNSVTIRSPKLFGGKSKSFPLGQISVSINTPMVGYSDITLVSQGTGMSVHGFTSSDAKRIKSLIEKGTSDQKEEARRQEQTKRKQEDDEWMNDLKRKNQRNNGETEYDQRRNEEVDRNRGNSSRPKEVDDRTLNMQAFENVASRMLAQAKIESRELTESEIISLTHIKETLEGDGGKAGEEYFSSSKAHARAFELNINDNLTAYEHLSAQNAIREVEEYWLLPLSERNEIDLQETERRIQEEKNNKENFEIATEEAPSTQNLNKNKDTKDIINMCEEILSRLESETGEKFVLIPEFEKFALSDEPVQIGYLLANVNLQSVRLNFTEEGLLYSVTYWKPAEKETKFTNYLGHLSFEKAIESIINYFKNPSAKDLIEYSETDYEYGDPDEIWNKYDELIKKLLAGNINSLIITAEPDRYKVFKVETGGFNLNYIRNSLKKDEDYFIITGELSDLELYVNLYKYNGTIIFIKDSDTSLRDENFVKIFQQAVDPEIIRPLRRPLNSSLADSALEVPDAFEFNGKIIFISALSKKRFISLLGKQSNVLEVVLNKHDTWNGLWGWLPGFELPISSGRISDRVKDKAAKLIEKATEEFDHIELSMRSMQKAILIEKKLECENDEIRLRLIRQQCSYFPMKENAAPSASVSGSI